MVSKLFTVGFRQVRGNEVVKLLVKLKVFGTGGFYSQNIFLHSQSQYSFLIGLNICYCDHISNISSQFILTKCIHVNRLVTNENISVKFFEKLTFSINLTPLGWSTTGFHSDKDALVKEKDQRYRQSEENTVELPCGLLFELINTRINFWRIERFITVKESG